MNAQPVRKMDKEIETADFRVVSSINGPILDKLRPMILFSVNGSTIIGFALYSFSKRGVEALNKQQMSSGMYVMITNTDDDLPALPAHNKLPVVRMTGNKLTLPSVLHLVEIEIFITNHSRFVGTRIHSEDLQKLVNAKVALQKKQNAAFVNLGRIMKFPSAPPSRKASFDNITYEVPDMSGRLPKAIKVPAYDSISYSKNGSSERNAGHHEEATIYKQSIPHGGNHSVTADVGNRTVLHDNTNLQPCPKPTPGYQQTPAHDKNIRNKELRGEPLYPRVGDEEFNNAKSAEDGNSHFAHMKSKLTSAMDGIKILTSGTKRKTEETGTGLPVKKPQRSSRLVTADEGAGVTVRARRGRGNERRRKSAAMELKEMNDELDLHQAKVRSLASDGP